MAIAFMGLFSIVIGEFISVDAGKKLVFPLMVLGVASVLYWYLTEANGVGDLRFYALVQFYPILAISLMLLLFTPCYSNVSSYWMLLLLYGVAKIFEYYDQELHSLFGMISGHSIKHILAAAGLAILLRSFERRVSNSQSVEAQFEAC